MNEKTAKKLKENDVLVWLVNGQFCIVLYHQTAANIAGVVLQWKGNVQSWTEYKNMQEFAFIQSPLFKELPF